MAKPDLNVRTREHFIMTYVDFDIVVALAREWYADGYCTAFATIHHDRDLWTKYDDVDPLLVGTPKEAHTHLLVRFTNACTVEHIQRLLDRAQVRAGVSVDHLQNTFTEAAINPKECVEYLTHSNKPWAYQYPGTAIVQENIGYWVKPKELRTRTDKIDSRAIINDMANGFNTYDLFQKYGNFYLFHKKQIDELYHQLVAESIVPSDDTRNASIALLMQDNMISDLTAKLEQSYDTIKLLGVKMQALQNELANVNTNYSSFTEISVAEALEVFK